MAFYAQRHETQISKYSRSESGIHLRAKINDQTIAVGLFNGIYPRLGNSVRELTKISSQQCHF